MTTNHTPGPWNYESEDNIIYSADGARIIDVSLIPRSIHVGLDERKANGQLAASAPELLEALEGLLAVSVDTSPAELRAMIAARETIAKAKGEQQ